MNKPLFAVLLCLMPFFIFYDASARADAADEKIAAFIDSYFSTWSNQDMKGYRNCFHPRATIQFIDSSMDISSYDLNTFIEEQSMLQHNSRVKMREIPLSKKIYREGGAAHVIVKWKLFAATREEMGFDHFVLVPVMSEWKIAYLAFYKIK
jgi:pyroglutamyl-peptidase